MASGSGRCVHRLLLIAPFIKPPADPLDVGILDLLEDLEGCGGVFNGLLAPIKSVERNGHVPQGVPFAALVSDLAGE